MNRDGKKSEIPIHNGVMYCKCYSDSSSIRKQFYYAKTAKRS